MEPTPPERRRHQFTIAWIILLSVIAAQIIVPFVIHGPPLHAEEYEIYSTYLSSLYSDRIFIRPTTLGPMNIDQSYFDDLAVDGALIQQLIDKNQRRFWIEDRFSLNSMVEINESGVGLSAIAINERGEALFYTEECAGITVIKMFRQDARWHIADTTAWGEFLC